MSIPYSDRLVMRWQDSDDTDERDVIFARLVRHCMRLPVVRRARRQTFAGVASHSPRWADEEEQAIRRAIWRSAKRWDRSRGVAFDAYVSRGLKVAIHDFWRLDAWIHDLDVHVPVAEWLHYRRMVSSMPSWHTGCPDGCPADLYEACTPSISDNMMSHVDPAVWDDYDDEEVL